MIIQTWWLTEPTAVLILTTYFNFVLVFVFWLSLLQLYQVFKEIMLLDSGLYFFSRLKEIIMSTNIYSFIEVRAFMPPPYIEWSLEWIKGIAVAHVCWL